MSTCPNILPSLRKLAKHSEFKSLRNEIKANAHILNASCPVFSRGVSKSIVSSNATRNQSRNRTRNRSRSRGGSDGRIIGGAITARQFKIFIYTVLMSVMAYLTMTPGAAGRGILDGFSSIYSGECSSMSQSVYAFFGMGNPICDSWNQMLLLIRNSLVGDVRSVATLGGILAIGVRTPMYIGYCIRMATYNVARLLPPQIIGENEIDILRRDANGSYRQLEIAVNRNGGMTEEENKLMVEYGLERNTNRRKGRRRSKSTNIRGITRRPRRKRRSKIQKRGSGRGKNTKRKKKWSWIWN